MTNGQEFQLELFNPTYELIAAEIFLNNKVLSGGKLVLKPGQRVFLDRYLDSPQKFKFETYEVGKSKAVEQAISYNGTIEVKFYKEEQVITTTYTQQPFIYYTHNYNPWDGTVTCNSDSNLNTTTNTNNVNFTSGNCTNTLPVPMMNIGNDEFPERLRKSLKGSLKSKKKETGTVGKGSVSKQTFEKVSYNFDYNPFHTIQYKILPLSEKQITSDDLNVRRYCPECGTKQKPNFKFCPSCGGKI
jgi:hypothetical protein